MKLIEWISGKIINAAFGPLMGNFMAWMSDWFIMIYDNFYGAGNVHEIFRDVELVLNSIVTPSAPGSVYFACAQAFVGAGVALATVYFLMDLGDQVSLGRNSTEAFMKSMLKYIAAVAVISNSIRITGVIGRIGSAAVEAVVTNGGAEANFVSKGGLPERLILGLGECKELNFFGYILMALIPLVLILVRNIMFYYAAYSRMFSIAVRGIFAPIAVADIYHGGSSSPGVSYLKKFAACVLQYLVIVGIVSAGAAVMTHMGGGTDPISCLLSAQPGMYMGYDVKAVKEFLDALFNAADAEQSSQYWMKMAVFVTEILAISRSSSWSNELIGV